MYRIEALGKTGRIITYTCDTCAELFITAVSLWDCHNISAISIQDSDGTEYEGWYR